MWAETSFKGSAICWPRMKGGSWGPVRRSSTPNVGVHLRDPLPSPPAGRLANGVLSSGALLVRREGGSEEAPAVLTQTRKEDSAQMPDWKQMTTFYSPSLEYLHIRRRLFARGTFCAGLWGWIKAKYSPHLFCQRFCIQFGEIFLFGEYNHLWKHDHEGIQSPETPKDQWYMETEKAM